jgi:hypothetical protein
MTQTREAAGDALWQRCLGLVEKCREKTPDKWDFAYELAEICKAYHVQRGAAGSGIASAGARTNFSCGCFIRYEIETPCKRHAQSAAGERKEGA